MPTYLLRAARDDDTYVAWSTIVDGPTFVGDESQALRWLQTQRKCQEPCCYQTQVLDRLDRARRTGTSSLDGFHGYDDHGMIVEQIGVLPRSALGPFAVDYRDGDEDDWMPYLQPFEDDEPTADKGS